MLSVHPVNRFHMPQCWLSNEERTCVTGTAMKPDCFSAPDWFHLKIKAAGCNLDEQDPLWCGEKPLICPATRPPKPLPTLRPFHSSWLDQYHPRTNTIKGKANSNVGTTKSRTLFFYNSTGSIWWVSFAFLKLLTKFWLPFKVNPIGSFKFAIPIQICQALLKFPNDFIFLTHKYRCVLLKDTVTIIKNRHKPLSRRAFCHRKTGWQTPHAVEALRHNSPLKIPSLRMSALP